MTTWQLFWSDSTIATLRWHISHLSSSDSIKPFYSNTPGETLTNISCLRSSNTLLHPFIPPVTHIKRLVTETFFSPSVMSPCCIALIPTSKLCLNSLSTSWILSHRHRDRHVADINGVQSGALKWLQARLCFAAWSRLFVCLSLQLSFTISFHQTKLIMNQDKRDACQRERD